MNLLYPPRHMQQAVGGDDVVEGLGLALGVDGAAHVILLQLLMTLNFPFALIYIKLNAVKSMKSVDLKSFYFK